MYCPYLYTIDTGTYKIRNFNPLNLLAVYRQYVNVQICNSGICCRAFGFQDGDKISKDPTKNKHLGKIFATGLF